MSFFYSRPAIDMTIESKPWADVKFITDDGEDLSEEEKKELYFKHGGDGTNPVDLPLFLDIMNVHEFGMTIRENKDLYTQQEYEDLCNQWKKEYYEYLIKKHFKT